MINTPTKYQVVFDITQTGFQHWFALAGGFIFIAFAVAMFWLARRGARTAGRWAKLQLVPLAIFLTVWSVLPFVWFAGKYRNYLHIRTALEQSHCDVVEGPVTQFGHLPDWSRSPGVGELLRSAAFNSATGKAARKMVFIRPGSFMLASRCASTITTGMMNITAILPDWRLHHETDGQIYCAIARR